MTTPVTLATYNSGKVQEFQAFFRRSRFSFVTMAEAGKTGKAVEDGATIYHNALKKAWHAHEKGRWTVSDDSGLFIWALEGRPGKDAATWAGEGATTAEITQFTLAQMEGKKDRRATFECCSILISPQGNIRSFIGKLSGTLLEAERVPPRPSMPYEGIFVPEGETRVLAEMDVEYRNTISHRGKALARLRKELEQIVL